MKITVESTTKIVTMNGIECRIWEGYTERGIRIHAYIPRVAVRNGLDTSQFEAELTEHAAPTPDVDAIPLRMLL